MTGFNVLIFFFLRSCALYKVSSAFEGLNISSQEVGPRVLHELASDRCMIVSLPPLTLLSSSVMDTSINKEL